MGRKRKKGVLRKRQLRARSEDEDLKALNRKRKPESRTTDKETLIKPERRSMGWIQKFMSGWRKSPSVPSTHTVTKTQRKILSMTMATYFQSSSTCGDEKEWTLWVKRHVQ